MLRDRVSHFVRKLRDAAPDFVMRAGIGDHALQEVADEVRGEPGKLGCQRFDTAEILGGALAATIGTVNNVAHGNIAHD
jgi:hypothetical protein